MIERFETYADVLVRRGGPDLEWVRDHPFFKDGPGERETCDRAGELIASLSCPQAIALSDADRAPLQRCLGGGWSAFGPTKTHWPTTIRSLEARGLIRFEPEVGSFQATALGRGIACLLRRRVAV